MNEPRYPGVDRRKRNKERDELFIDTLNRYGIDPHEMIEVFQWARDQKKMVQKMQMGVVLTVISLVVGGVVLALWEGFRNFARL